MTRGRAGRVRQELRLNLGPGSLAQLPGKESFKQPQKQSGRRASPPLTFGYSPMSLSIEP